MIEKIELNQSLVESGLSTKHSNDNVSMDNNTDVSMHVDYACFINMAMQQLPQSDPQQVEKAREALISGQLDTPENIYKAAENIAKYGI